MRSSRASVGWQLGHALVHTIEELLARVPDVLGGERTTVRKPWAIGEIIDVDHAIAVQVIIVDIVQTRVSAVSVLLLV